MDLAEYGGAHRRSYVRYPSNWHLRKYYSRQHTLSDALAPLFPLVAPLPVTDLRHILPAIANVLLVLDQAIAQPLLEVSAHPL